MSRRDLGLDDNYEWIQGLSTTQRNQLIAQLPKIERGYPPEEFHKLKKRLFRASAYFSYPADTIKTGGSRNKMPTTAVVVQDPKVTRDLAERMAAKLIGQPEAIGPIVQCCQMHAAGLSPQDRPAGVFLFLGPTGSGKTRTVEALAECLHGSARNVLRVDCGEFTHSHEVAKLVGAPPGYLGHRETQPIFTQGKLTGIKSDGSKLSIVLFDEIEKASPDVLRVLLGVLDKGTLKTGTNEIVNFEDTIIFFTSNLGAREIEAAQKAAWGLGAAHANTANTESRAIREAKRHFSPEFFNRLDHTVVYNPLGRDSMQQILDIELKNQQDHIINRMGTKCFEIVVSAASRAWLLDHGFSRIYGARELKRTLQQNIMAPLALQVVAGDIKPGARVEVDVVDDALFVRAVVPENECPVCSSTLYPKGGRCGACGHHIPARASVIPPLNLLLKLNGKTT